MSGTYILVLNLESAEPIQIGRLGQFLFPAGWYLYVGSAMGPGGFAARVTRHQRRIGADKRAHWHIDYLREKAGWGDTWVRASAERVECAWAVKLQSLPGAQVVVPGFGASDCSCRSHLVRVPVVPDEGWFAHELGAQRMRWAPRS